MLRNKRRSLGAGVAAAALILAACGSDSDESSSGSDGESCGSPAGETVKIVENSWTASAVGAAILQNLIETKLCNKAEIVKIDENAMFAGFADGSLDLVSEFWPSGLVDEEKAFIDKGDVVDLGELGVVGQIGWYVPDYVAKANPALATWEGLKDPALAKTFATAETGDLGRFLGTDPSYSTIDEPLIKNLELPFKVVYSGAEATTVAEVDSAIAAKKPILLYWWSPTAAAGKYNLVEVKLPEFTPGCADVPENTKCGYPADPLKKLVSKKLEAKAPKVWAMMQKFKMTNQDQLGLLPSVEIDKKAAADVAKEWIDKNEAVWKTWIS